ncbi:efflux transporter outer membrane subunit [Methylomonas sp. LW13]|nr:RND transporter [Methylomonas sp. Kb3]QBC26368.1 efflux transporter outer membrane subunit [Methylomonas sp. LW13]
METTMSIKCLAATVAAGLLLQACGIPDMTTKMADKQLPDQFKPGVIEQASSATVKWQEFFDDPHLLSLIDTAVANNKEINIALQRISIAENEIQARKGEYLPFVKLGAAASGEKTAKHTRNGAVEENLEIAKGQAFPAFLGDYQFGLFSTWEIDVWKKLRNATQVAVYEYMASGEGRNFLLTHLVAEVAHAYYELLALDNQLENLQQNIALQQNGLLVVRQLQIYARTNTLAVKRYEAEVAKNQARQYEIEQQITVVENRINTLLGRTPQPIERSSAGFMSIKPKALSAGLPSELLQNRPDIRKAELELKAADLNIDVARANFYPSFGIKAGVGFQAFALKYLINTPESLAAMVAGELVAPLVNKNAITAEYKNANAKQVQAAYEYEQSIINAYAEVANQLSNIDKLDKNYQLKRQQVDSLVKSIDVANQLFISARADYLEVLLTQRDALEAKKELIETKQKQISAMVELYKALGGGWQS